MANPPRSRKRVRPPRRAPDGSSFIKCDGCGASVAIVLIAFHECPVKKDKDVKRLKGECDEYHEKKDVKRLKCEENLVKKDVKRLKDKGGESPSVVEKKNDSEEPRSAFQFFWESYIKGCKGGDMIENNRKAFEEWKAMSIKFRWPYLLEAEKAEKAYVRTLRQEVEQMSQEKDEEADSAEVGKFDKKYYQDYGNPEHCGNYHRNWSEDSEEYEEMGADEWTVNF